jgi:hypothetical protein
MATSSTGPYTAGSAAGGNKGDSGESSIRPITDSPEEWPRLSRGWSQQIETTATALQIKLRRARMRPPPDGMSGEEKAAICDGVNKLIDGAQWAARVDVPLYRRLGSWWRGANIEAAFRKSHQAEAELAKLYTDAEVEVEGAAAVARTDVALNRDDPVRAEARRLLIPPPVGADPAAAAVARRLLLSKTVQVGYEGVDGAHTRLRNLRNVIWSTTSCIAVLVSIFVGFVAGHPTSVPLCFGPQVPAATDLVACPASDGFGTGPQNWDVVVVTLLGLLGGALAAAVSIRNLRGTQTPYDVPIALAWLKVPVGALTAIGALIAIRGEFVPGLSQLDSQEQILAYALVFGYAQQLLTGLIDRKALDVMSSVPSKDAQQNRPAPPPAEQAPPPTGQPKAESSSSGRKRRFRRGGGSQ